MGVDPPALSHGSGVNVDVHPTGRFGLRASFTIDAVNGLTRSLTLMSPNRLTLRFPDVDVERGFLAGFAAEARLRYRLIVILCLGLWLSFGLVDHRLFHGDALVIARTLRFAVVTPLLFGAVLFGYSSPRCFTRYWQLVVAMTWGLMTGVLIYWGSIVDADQIHHSPTAVSLAILAGYSVTMLRFIYAVPVAALCTLSATSMYAYMHEPRGLINDSLDTGVVWMLLANVIGMFACYELERFRRDKYAHRLLLDEEQKRAEALLLNILPASMAARIKAGDTELVDACEAVTVLFGDLVGFTALAEQVTPRCLVDTLNDVFTEFDEIAARHGLEKIKTIGDEYMVVGGVPESRTDHAEAVAAMALEMLAAVGRRRGDDVALGIRIGIHSGPVVAGVIGVNRFSYDVWGDTVNTASRMQSHGLAGAIQVTDATRRHLSRDFELERRGCVDIKGKGQMETFLLVGHKAAADLAPAKAG